MGIHAEDAKQNISEKIMPFHEETFYWPTRIAACMK